MCGGMDAGGSTVIAQSAESAMWCVRVCRRALEMFGEAWSSVHKVILWQILTLHDALLAVTVTNDQTSGHPNFLLDTGMLPQSLCSLPLPLLCSSLCPGGLSLMTCVFNSLTLLPLFAGLHHPIMIKLIVRKGWLIHHPQSKVALIGLGEKEKFHTGLTFIITNHVVVRKKVQSPLIASYIGSWGALTLKGGHCHAPPWLVPSEPHHVHIHTYVRPWHNATVTLPCMTTQNNLQASHLQTSRDGMLTAHAPHSFTTH